MTLQGRQFYMHLLHIKPLWLRLCNSFPFDVVCNLPYPSKIPTSKTEVCHDCKLQKVNFYFNILSQFSWTFQKTWRYTENTTLIWFDILWPEEGSESKNQKYFSVERSTWLIWGSNLVSFDQIKLQKVWIWTYANDHLAVIFRYPPGKAYTLFRSSCYWWVLPSVMPSSSCNHKRSRENSLGLWCFPLAPEPACLCHLLSSLCSVWRALAGAWCGKSLWPFFCAGVEHHG